MKKDLDFTFEEIFEQNKKRIHYHIHKLRINDPHQELYQEGLLQCGTLIKPINQIKVSCQPTSIIPFTIV